MRKRNNQEDRKKKKKKQQSILEAEMFRFVKNCLTPVVDAALDDLLKDFK